MVKDITKDVYDLDLITVISEVNLVGSNPKEWWIALVLLATFQPASKTGEKVYM